ncbi:hypothetical protein RSJ21_10530 [Clostridium botulinum]|uniref:Uncharacterized protein n=2 Tax=Clostridium botulinum TaxID=1491 RepID=A5I361_CLOBH|nr:hypothetical protein RSJ15_09700 [Clostridium botulinum]NFK35778.1 hypothetical protein [Clostridium botulinum H04402 065]CAL83478.1 hypothetical protein CBO1936 [Clostridium botulinum A str. ATCC 3502]AUN10997.1 hypothetical protein RSJ6_10990 [Clostridium botulinum]AUN17900.1 hypothetical protein B2M06_09955 [Clostridium botulinum]
MTLDKVKLLSRYIESFKYSFFIILFIEFVQIVSLIIIGIVC